MSTVGSIFGAIMQKDMLRSQARLAEVNAGISDSNARNITRAGTIEESRVKLAGAQAKGTQRAQIAGSGIDMGSNTALARLTGTDLITEVDAQTVRSNALRAAWGQRFEAGDARRKAQSLRASAKSISPLMVGATSMIEGATAVASSWYSLRKDGLGQSGGKKPTAVTVGDDETRSMIVAPPVPFSSELTGEVPKYTKRQPWAMY